MRIILAIGHKLLSGAIRAFLPMLSPDAILREASTFAEIIVIAEDMGCVDLVILRHSIVGLQDMNSIEAVRKSFPGAKLVLLTTVNDHELILDALSVGVNSVVSEDISGDGMLNALRLVMPGEVYLPPAAMIAFAHQMVLAATESPHSAVQFSPAEATVASMLLEGLSNKAMAQRIGVQESAIKARMRSLCRKVGVSSRAQAVRALMSNSAISKKLSLDINVTHSIG